MNHQVAPASQALHCTDCHTEQGYLDFKALGYTEERTQFLKKLAEPGALDEPPHQYLTRYDGPATCMTCHPEAGMQVAQSKHYAWQAVVQNIAKGYITLNATEIRYYGLPAPVTGLNWLGILQPQEKSLPAQAEGCAQCHVGFGSIPNPPDALTQDDYNNVDCLLCHGPDYNRTAAESAGEVQNLPAANVNIIDVVQNVTLPTNDMCLRCHLGAGGGDNYQHGDTPTAESGDVHVAAGLTCIDCHKFKDHLMAGAENLNDDSSVTRVSCTDCHTGKHPVGFTAIDIHEERIACQTCHIPAIAQDLNYPTSVSQDWTAAVLDENGLYTPQITLASRVTPVYRWWDGLPQSFSQDSAGSIDNENAKLYPWKLLSSILPVDAVSQDFLPISARTYYMTGNLDEAVADGAEILAEEYSGTWEYQNP